MKRNLSSKTLFFPSFPIPSQLSLFLYHHHALLLFKDNQCKAGRIKDEGLPEYVARDRKSVDTSSVTISDSSNNRKGTILVMTTSANKKPALTTTIVEASSSSPSALEQVPSIIAALHGTSFQRFRSGDEIVQIPVRHHLNTEPFVVWSDVKECFPGVVRVQCGDIYIPFRRDGSHYRYFFCVSPLSQHDSVNLLCLYDHSLN